MAARRELTRVSPTGMEALSDDTKRWTTNPVLLEAERQKARADGSALRRRPPPPPLASHSASGAHAVPDTRPSSAPRASLPVPTPTFVDPALVRALYDQYTRVVGPVAKAVFEAELRALRRLPSTLTERDCEFLVERLTSRIPVTSARARFLAAVHDVFA
jgi:hypothetical protein